MLKFISDNNASEKIIDSIEAGLSQFNRAHTGLDQPDNRAIYIKDGDEIKGGIVFVCMKPWCYIKLLWVSEDLRGGGYGAKLLSAAEDEARKQGSTKVMLDTFSFQAPEFYKKQGYCVISKIEDYPVDGASRYWLSKVL